MMLKRLKGQTSRILASVLTVVMIFALIPAGASTTAFATTPEHPASLTIKVSDAEGTVAGAEVKIISESEEFSKAETTDATGVVAINGAELEAYLGEKEETFTISITKEGYKAKNETITLSKSKTTESFEYKIEKLLPIEGISVSPYVGKYDEAKHDAVTVTGTQKEDSITYSTDGGESFAPEMPTVENPGDSVKVIVKVERVDCLTFTSDEVTASVSKGEITGVTVTPYAGKTYDGATHDAVIVEGTKAGDTITYSTDGANYSATVPTIKIPSSLTVHIKVVRNEKYEVYNQNVEASVINATIQGVVISPYVGVYDGAEHPAVTVAGTKEGDIITYSTDGLNYTDKVPTIQNVGSKDVHVKVQREYYDDLPTPPAELKVTATVSQAEIKGVTATGYSAKYDGKDHDAVTSVTGTIEGDIITYSKKENGPYEKTNPTVKRVRDSGTYYVKIHRNDNYEDLIIPVTVSITKNNQQTIEFGKTADITYNAKNTFQYQIVEKSAKDSEGKITYSFIRGTAEATVDADDGTVTYTSAGTVKVRATIAACDNYEAASTEYEVTIKYIDTPVFSVISPNYTDNKSLKWYNADVVISAAGWTVIEGTNAVDAKDWAESITKTDENKYDFNVSFKDENGNITALVPIEFAIDKTSPKIKYVTFEDSTPLEKVISILSFGLFSRKEVKINVAAGDEAETNGSPNSGIKSIRLFKYPVSGGREEVPLDLDKTDTFTIKPEFEGTIKVLVEDNVGNTLGEQLVTESNSNMKDQNGYVMLEKDPPNVSDFFVKPLEGVRKQDGTNSYSGDVEIQFSAQDTGAGLYAVSVKLNEGDYPKLNELTLVTFAQQDRKEHNYTLSTAGIKPDKEGKYNFTVTVTDNAGNVTEKSLVIEKDQTSPTITGFDFSLPSYNPAQPVKVEKCVSVEDYGYYFKEKVTVTISAKDNKEADAHEMISGVKSITVVLHDKDGEYYTVNAENAIVKITSENEAVAHEATDGKFAFDVDKDFKGQIYAFATDMVGNTPVNSAFDFTKDGVVKEGNILAGYQYPNGAILESPAKHEATSSIEIKAPEKTATQNEVYAYAYNGSAQKDAAMSYDDTQKVPLYNSNPTFKISVKDEYSGIRDVKVTVIEKGVSAVKTVLTIENDGSTEDMEWTIAKEAKSNLVTSATRDVEVVGNSNNMVILVELTDRAGNRSYDYYTFGIDTTHPRIEVTYEDKNTPDETYKNFFNADRKATIRITERNFDKNDFVYNIQNTDGVIPVLGDWSEHKNTENPDKTYYTAEILYHADGDYTFDIISYADLAKNKAEDFPQHKFTIDQTLPTVSVAYDNMSSLNGNYYKADRIATITIVEHNFDAARVNIIGTATDNGATVAFPTASAWSDNGDTHTATIRYTSDAKYRFDIEFKDKAGNSIADYTPEEFYVDKTAPTLEISGVADKSANKGTVAPVITFTDTNYDGNAISYTLTGVNNGKVNYSFNISDVTNGQKVTFADFERVQKVDDIYTLSATITDMAGNETTKSITFSANRFGSVYDLAALGGINGKYLQNEEDVVFTETNVDSLKKGETKLKLSKNGTPKELVEGTDYTVTETGGNGKWSQYKYTVNKSLFADDGRYSISVYSVDAAGNINENIDEAKKAEISFGIDKTKPVIVPIDFENGTQYPVELKTVSLEIKDNLVLEGVKIYLNGAEVKYSNEGETYTFDVPEKNEKQNVKIVAVDAAGNEFELLVENFLVSTNLFVRWFNNTPLFVGSIAGVVILCGVIVLLVMFKRKKTDK